MKENVKKGVIGILVCMLMIASAVLPVAGTMNNKENINVIEDQSSVLEYGTTSVDDEWPMYLHDNENTGYSTSAAPWTNKTKWIYTANDDVFGYPAIVNGKVYIGADDETFYCLDADTGQKIWDSSIPGGAAQSSPAVVDGKVYQGSTYDYLYCWDADTGGLIWKYYKDYGRSKSPAVVDGMVYISKCRGQPGNNGWLYCLDAETGDELWKYDMGFFELSSPAVYDGKVYLGSENQKLYCFDSENGSKLWEYRTGRILCHCAPTLFNGSVYCGGLETYRLDAETGEEIWSYEVRTEISPAIAYGRIYFLGVDGYLYCLNVETGEEIWNCYVGNTCASSTVVADWKVYQGIDTGELICLDSYTGEKFWDYQLHVPSEIYNSPAVYNGRIYIGGGLRNKVYCFEDPSSPPTDPTIGGLDCGKPGVEYKYDFTAIDPDGDDVYYYVDWGDGTNTGWLGPYESGTEIELSHTWNELGNHVVRVRAKDTYDVRSHWSEWTVGISNPPSAPVIDGSSCIRKGKSYDFTFNSADPEGDDVEYTVIWELSGGKWYGPYSSGEDVILNHTWTKLGKYTIKAKARDIYGVEGDWGYLEVTVPKDKQSVNMLLTRLQQQFPNVFQLLRQMMGV